MLGAFLHLMQDDPRAHAAIERAHAAIEHAQVAVWLSEDMLQSLQDAGVRVREAGGEWEAGGAIRVVRKISERKMSLFA